MSHQVKLSIVALLLSGCACVEPAERGPVVSQFDRDALICFSAPQGPLSAGQDVRFVRSVARPLNAKSTVLTTRLEPVGIGRIVRTLGERCSIVQVPYDSDVRTGDQIVVATAD